MKNLNSFIEEAALRVTASKKCGKDQYYCNTDKKCKPIPRGYHVMRSGYLAKDEEPLKKNGNGKNGNGNGNGNGGNGNGNGGNGNGGGLSESFVPITLNLEVVKTESERNLGLMFREHLEENSGMLFVFESSKIQSFHMRNTPLHLDIAFITEEGIVESIKELQPLRSRLVSSDSEVPYALEVNRGWFTKNDIKVGDKILEI